MVENIGFSEDGKKIVTEINGKHSSMLMDIEVIKMKKGDKIVILEKGIIKSQYEIEEESNNRDLLDDKFVELKKKIINDLKVI